MQWWFGTKKLYINISKTKECVVRSPSARHFITSQSLSFIEQLSITKLLAIYISATFSAAALVEYILSVDNQRRYEYLHSSRVKASRVMLYTLAV